HLDQAWWDGISDPISYSPYSSDPLLLQFHLQQTAILNSPVGPKTTHFWGPVSNLGFFIAGVADMKKPPEMLSGNMTGVLCVYSALFMRFAWMVRPRNHMLLASHALNESVQLYQLSRWAKGKGYLQPKEDKAPSST
ncbi:hypothetical protein M8C21_012736, partial [Ambrosia artemisiifolia]